MYWIRLTLWGVTLAFFYVLLFIRPANGPLAVTLMVLCMLLPGCGEAYADQRRRRDWYARRFASVDELRSVVADEAALRRIRDEKGVFKAARELRRQFPRCPVAESVKLVESL
ncbi:hypothetical protein ACIQM0_32535 [Streptomyces sp. NPDC091387]|uniref:hypothetical protein n=1 Tax=Streptomyces sp. NPDC091387 TaxID=3365998 RepID=UPI003821A23C